MGVKAKPYHLPYGALLPKGLENLLVAGRCIGGDHEAAGQLPDHRELPGDGRGRRHRRAHVRPRALHTPCRAGARSGRGDGFPGLRAVRALRAAPQENGGRIRMALT